MSELSIKEQASQEFKEEKRKEAVKRMKLKLEELDKAELVVRNIKRELEDLEDELAG